LPRHRRSAERLGFVALNAGRECDGRKIARAVKEGDDLNVVACQSVDENIRSLR
jgi:hypothetical protein